jgi:hypothetical protein
MSLRKILIICLILTTLIVPLIQLSIGFYYVNSSQLCSIQPDIMLLMSIGGVFQTIFFAAAFAFVFSITPPRFKTEKKLTAAQLSAKGNNRASQLLIGKLVFIYIDLLNLLFRLYHIYNWYLCNDIFCSSSSSYIWKF